MSERSKKVIRFILSLLLAAAFLYFAFKGLDWREFIESAGATRWGYIILSMVTALLALVFRAERWRLQLATLDGDVTRSSIWHGSNIGNFLSLIIPGIGEFYRCAFVSTKKSGYDRTFGTIVMERTWDIAAILILLLTAVLGSSGTLIPFMREHVLGPFSDRFSISFWWVTGCLALLCFVTTLAMWKNRSRSKLCGRCISGAKGIVKGFSAFALMPHKPLFTIYTVLIWCMYILMTWFTFFAVPGLEDLNFADAVFISAIGNIASVIPTPGNLGAYHYLVGLAISNVYQSSWETGLLCATLSHGSHALLLILMAIISYPSARLYKKGTSACGR